MTLTPSDPTVTLGCMSILEAAFTNLWEELDVNDDGRVVIEELKLALSSGWSKVVGHDYASQLMLSIDTDKDGNISLEEWNQFFSKMWCDDVTEHIDGTMEYLLFGQQQTPPLATA